jgi:hypothetical protein
MFHYQKMEIGIHKVRKDRKKNTAIQETGARRQKSISALIYSPAPNRTASAIEPHWYSVGRIWCIHGACYRAFLCSVNRSLISRRFGQLTSEKISCPRKLEITGDGGWNSSERKASESLVGSRTRFIDAKNRDVRTNKWSVGKVKKQLY